MFVRKKTVIFMLLKMNKIKNENKFLLPRFSFPTTSKIMTFRNNTIIIQYFVQLSVKRLTATNYFNLCLKIVEL